MLVLILLVINRCYFKDILCQKTTVQSTSFRFAHQNIGIHAWINQLTVDSQITAERIQADLIADDSTVVFNAATGQIAAAQLVGTFTGNVVGDTQGHHVGTVDGDLSGSVFADDSTLIIDAQNRRFTGTINGTTRMNSSDETEVQLTLESLENTSKINLRRQSATSLAGNTSLQYGTISFGREDTSGVLTTAIMFARENEFRIGQSSTGAFGVESVYITWKRQQIRTW